MTFSRSQLLALCVLVLSGVLLFRNAVEQRLQTNRCQAYLNAMRTFAASVDEARDKDHAIIQPNLALWKHPPSFGGRYEWIKPWPQDPEALGAIRLTGFPPAPEVTLQPGDFRRLQQLWGDNPIPKASLKAGFNGWPVCVLHQP